MAKVIAHGSFLLPMSVYVTSHTIAVSLWVLCTMLRIDVVLQANA